MTTALVKPPSGEGFIARVTQLRPNSILLAIDRPLQFRDRVKIDLLGTELDGEVVFAAEHEAAVTFAMSPEIFELIEAVESEKEAPAEEGVSDLSNGPALPVLDPKGVLEVADDVEMLAHLLALWSGRPVVVSSPVPPEQAILRHAGVRIEVHATALSGELYSLRLADRTAAADGIRRLKASLDAVVGAAPRSEPSPDPLTEPLLEEDGRTVAFSSHAQYAEQYRINLEKGALVARAAPLPPGTQRELQLMIPGAPAVAVSAQVMFQGPGTLGFSLSLNDTVKAALKVAAEEPGKLALPMSFMDVTGSVSLPRSNSGPRLSPAIGYEVDLKTKLEVEELLSFTASRPKDIAGAKGSYLRAIDFLLSSDLDLRLRLTGEEEICLWLYRGRVVYATRAPEKAEDVIGRRLIASRAVTRAMIDTVVPEIEPSRPLGALLVEKGKLTQDALNRELRAQIVDRAAAPSGFAQGRLQVLGWSEPPIRTKLLPVSGRYLVLELIRNELRKWTQEELTSGLAKQFDLEVRIDLSGIDSSLRLGQKEHRFYQRVAQSPASLGAIGTLGGAGPSEGLRLCVLGCALGFARLAKVDREKILEKQRHTTEDILTDQLERSSHSTPFEVLGIHWSATQREIRNAFDNERKKLMMRRREDESTRELVQKIERKLEEALRTLNSSGERKSLRDASADAMERQHAAEHLVQQAEIAIFREELEVAADLLDTADEIFAVRRAKQLRARLRDVMMI